MAEFSSHTQGTFAWAELATSDQKGAVAFYRALFGWGVSEQPIGPDEVYSMLQLRGLDVAAACGLQPAERAHGVPPHWNMYVSVTDVDAAAKTAEGLGATILAAPFDVMEYGRMAVLQDPTGAAFAIWQAKAHVGARILGEPGALCWTELTTRDTKKAQAFYTSLFLWTAERLPDLPIEYTQFSINGQPGAGMLAMPAEVPAQVPSYWMPYFQVADCDASTAKAKGLGAGVVVGPQDVPGTGRFTVMTDPQGAMFAVFTPAGA